MEEVVKALEDLSRRDVVDIIAIFSPILISIVAIIISLRATRRQNKIMLFDLKYNIIATARRFLTFEKNIYNKREASFIVFAFDAMFELNTDELTSGVHSKAKIVSRLRLLQNEIRMGEFFVKQGFEELLKEIVEQAHKILLKAQKNLVDNILINDLHNNCKNFEDNYIADIIKQLK